MLLLFRANCRECQFPGLIYRPNSSPVVLLIFVSGKIVITGGKSSNDVKEGWRHLYPFVRRYIKAAPEADAASSQA